MKINPFAAGLAGAMALMLAACGSDPSEEQIADVVAGDEQLSRFTEGLEATGLDGVLDGKGSYTLLAPSDEAFAALGPEGEALFDDPERGAILAAVLREHMVPGALDPEAIRKTIDELGGEVYIVSFGNGELSVTTEGEDLIVTTAGGQRARLSEDAVVSKNGVIIPIDAVLVDKVALAGQ